MKKTTLWKLVACVLLIALCLPLIPKAVPPTEAVAVNTVAPLPYAMEQYGQHHSGIYAAKNSITLDGELDDAYALMDSYDDEAGNFNGVFISSNEDGSGVTEIASEYAPDLLAIFGAYDDTFVYLYVKTVSRTGPNGYALSAKFGFNFTSSQKDAQESKKTYNFAIASDQSSLTESDYFISTATEATKASDSTGNYNVNSTVYEFAVPWTEIVPDGQTPEESFDKMYLTLCSSFYDGGKEMYRIYGVPNNVALPSGSTIGAAFGTVAGTFTPNVVHLLGEKGGFTAAPSVEKVERTDSNTTMERSFEATLSLKEVEKENVKEAGIIFTADASTLATATPVWTAGGEGIFKTTESEGDSTLSFKVSFETAAADYEKFFSIRPYVLYSDDSVVYGTSYSNTPAYFDAMDSEWEDHINLLMIGNSSCTYFLDEMVQIAKADNIYLYVARIYKSGASCYENWTFLVNDLKNASEGVMCLKYCSPDVPSPRVKRPNTSKDILKIADWDYISLYCSSKGNEYTGIYREGYSASYPYLEDAIAEAGHVNKYITWLKRYYPNAKLYLQQGWSRQIGYGYKNDSVVYNPDGSVQSGVIKAGYEERIQRMENIEDQNYQYYTTVETAKKVSEVTKIPMIPNADGFQIARANPLIGDTLCNRASGTDYAHDGDVGGGQYLNAAMYYEVITGNDVRGNTWVPTGYDLPQEKVWALQEAAHEAVLALYGPDHYNK